MVDGPHTQSVSVSWDHPEQPQDEFTLRPIEGFTIQAKGQILGDAFVDMAEVGEGENLAEVRGLLPGTSYDVRVLSTNEAGATPSESITIATNATSVLYSNA